MVDVLEVSCANWFAFPGTATQRQAADINKFIEKSKALKKVEHYADMKKALSKK